MSRRPPFPARRDWPSYTAPEALPAIERLLALARLRPFFLFEALPNRVIEADELSDVGLEFETLRNLYTAADYAAALRDAGLER